MGFTPWYKGDRLPQWTISLVPDSGTLDLTGISESDFTLLLLNPTTKAVVITGGGTFSNLIPASGGNPTSIVYAVAAGDVTIAGDYEVRAVIKRGTASQRTFAAVGIFECQL